MYVPCTSVSYSHIFVLNRTWQKTLDRTATPQVTIQLLFFYVFLISLVFLSGQMYINISLSEVDSQCLASTQMFCYRKLA